MTDAEVTQLLKAAQMFWKKYKSNVPRLHDAQAWGRILAEAEAPLKGLPDRAAGVMVFFAEELDARAREMEAGNG